MHKSPLGFGMVLMAFLASAVAGAATAGTVPAAGKVGTVSVSSSSGGDWKAADNSGDVEFSGLLGLGLVGNQAGFLLTGAAAKKIVPSGLIADITNPLFIEAELGPVFGLSSGEGFYSVHLRWNFQYDSQWTLYALGGVGGDFGNYSAIYPRFGIGAFLRVNDLISMRGEVSHEAIAIGASFALF